MRRFLKIVLQIDAGIFVFAGAICLLFTRITLGSALIWTGLGGIVIGTLTALGGWEVAEGEYNLKYDQKIPQFNYERSPEKWSEMHKSYSFCLYMGAASVVPIIVGLLIDHFLKR